MIIKPLGYIMNIAFIFDKFHHTLTDANDIFPVGKNYPNVRRNEWKFSNPNSTKFSSLGSTGYLK